MRKFTYTGLVGLLIFATLDAFAALALHQAAAEPFSRGWWGTWFPSGAVWLVLLIIGLSSTLSDGAKRRPTE